MTANNTVQLQPRSSCSFYTSNLNGLIAWLLINGFSHLRVRDIHNEAARLGNDSGALVVLYNTGSVLVQGKAQERTMALLQTLVVEREAAEQAVLPW